MKQKPKKKKDNCMDEYKRLLWVLETLRTNIIE